MERPPPPPGIDLSEDRRPDIVAASVATWLLAVGAVTLRIVTRRTKGVPLWLDDWFILAALPFSCVQVFGIAGYAVSRGLGRHIWATPADSLHAWAISLFIAELSYFLTFVCVKWSILAFYWRSFNIRNSIRIPIWILASIVGLWGLAVVLVSIFQCRPTRAFWDRFDPDHPLSPSEYHCDIDDTKFFYGNAIPTMITDVLMLLLPIPYIWRLQLLRPQKLAIAGIFFVGIFVTVVSIVRLTYLIQCDLKDPDVTWNFVDIGLWSVIEVNIAIFCACLPFFRPLLSKFVSGIANLPVSRHLQTSDGLRVTNKDSVRTWNGDERYGVSSAHVKMFNHGDNSETDEHPFAYLPDDGSAHSIPTKDGVHTIELQELPDRYSLGRGTDGIMVTREIHMQHQSV